MFYLYLLIQFILSFCGPFFRAPGWLSSPASIDWWHSFHFTADMGDILPATAEPSLSHGDVRRQPPGSRAAAASPTHLRHGHSPGLSCPGRCGACAPPPTPACRLKWRSQSADQLKAFSSVFLTNLKKPLNQ